MNSRNKFNEHYKINIYSVFMIFKLYPRVFYMYFIFYIKTTYMIKHVYTRSPQTFVYIRMAIRQIQNSNLITYLQT